jgi:hypothetical protein
MESAVDIVRAAQPSALSNTSESVLPPVTGVARVLPVDPGFSIESHMYMRQVKGEDIVFSYRADPSLLGRPMPSTQTGTPDEWRLNFDVFVLCDGHSGTQVCSVPSAVAIRLGMSVYRGCWHSRMSNFSYPSIILVFDA